MITKYAEKSNNKLKPYLTIAFTYFDYMLWCGVLSCLCGIVSGILENLYKKMIFESIINWSYGLSRMAIVFAVYVLCLLIYTIGLMIAYSYQRKENQSKTEVDDEGI